MSLPISDQVVTVDFREHFNILLKELKHDPRSHENLTQELRDIFAAIADRKPSVEIERERFNLMDLSMQDLHLLIKVANEFFSSQHDGLLDNTLLENLSSVEKIRPDHYTRILMGRTKAALTMNNVSNLEVKETKTVQEVKAKIDEASEDIKKREKQRKYAKVATAAAVAGIAAGLGLFIAGIAVLSGGALFAALMVGAFVMVFSGVGAALSGPLASKLYLDIDKKKHSYWTYILTYSQTEDFQEYKKFQTGDIDTDSIDFLETAALLHLKSKHSLDYDYVDRLQKLERKQGDDFQERNASYIFSKTTKFEEMKEKFPSANHSDPDFIRFAYLKSLERKQKVEHKRLFNKFEGG